MFADLDLRPDTLAHLERSLAAPSHAYLLHGPDDELAQRVARRLARALLELEPAGTEMHPDLHLLEPEGVTWRLEQIADLWSDINERPFAANRSIYLIDRAEAMTDIVQHSLLKVIEEPPAHACVLLTTNRPRRLLPTVRSRCVGVAVVAPPRAREHDPALLALAAALIAEGSHETAIAAREIGRGIAARGAARGRETTREELARRQLLGLDDSSAEGRRAAKAAEQLARRRERREAQEAALDLCDAFAVFYRDVLAASLGADGALLHSPDRAAVADAVGAGLAPAAERALAATRDTRRSLDTLTLTPALAVEGLFHRIRLESRAGRAQESPR